MFVSVAICTWNRARLLDQTLRQMRSLIVPPGLSWELVVVNNNCTDDTDAVLRAHGEHLPIRRLSETKPGLSHARNCALDNTAAEWILWTDDDVLVSERWLESFVGTATRQPAAVIGGPIDPWFPEPPDPDVLEAFPVLRGGYIGIDYGHEERILDETEPIWGANMAYRRSRTAHLRFDPSLGRVGNALVSGDDVDFLMRVKAEGGLVFYSPNMRVKHYVDPARMTESYLLKFYESLGVTSIRMNQIQGRRILGFPAWVIRRFVESAVAARYHALRGRSTERLTSLREFHRCRGMLKAAWAVRRQQS